MENKESILQNDEVRLSDVMDTQEQPKVAISEPAEEVKSVEVDNSKQEIIANTNEVIEDPSQRLVGNNGVVVPVEALEKDKSTPGAHLSTLFQANQELEKQVEEAKKLKEQKEAADKQAKELEIIEQEKKNTFNDNVVEVEEEKEKVDEDIPDLTKVTILKSKDNKKLFGDIMKKRRESVHTTKVVLPNSGYTASVMGMSSPEIRNYSTTLSGLDNFGFFEFKYKEMFKRIKETSIGTMTFDTFLKRTALMEYEILNYGLFSSTYPDKSEYPFTCPKCGAKDVFVYQNKQYLDVNENDPEKKKATLESMLNVLKGQAVDPVELFNNSATNKLCRKYLKNSKIIVELRHPTLYDQMYDVVRNMTEELKKDNEELLNIMPFIATVLFPTPETVNDDVPQYVPCDDLQMKVMALNTIDDEDDEALSTAIEEEILNKYKLRFTLTPPACKSCGFQPDPEPVGQFDQMLFMMHQIKIANRK